MIKLRKPTFCKEQLSYIIQYLLLNILLATSKTLSKHSGLFLECTVGPKLLRLNAEFCNNSKMSVWTIPQNSMEEEKHEVPYFNKNSNSLLD